MKTRTLSILTVVTLLVIVAAVFFAREKQDGIPSGGALLFPDLKARLNEVKEISIQSKDARVTVTRQETFWGVNEKHGYRAAMDKVRGFLIGLAELTILEPKTSNPELYGKLGLQELDAEGSGSTLLTVRGTEGAALVTLLVGNRRLSRAGSSQDELYVRQPQEPQTWLVLGRLKPDAAPDQWLDEQILNLDSQRVQQVTVTHPGGEILTVRREDPIATDYQVVGLPEQATGLSKFTVNNIADTIAHLPLDDVQPLSDAKLPAEGGVQAVLETFDGLRVTLRIIEKGGTHYTTVRAEFDRTLVRDREEPPEEQKDEAAFPVRLKSLEEAQEEVKQLNQNLAGWAFVIPSFRAEAIAKTKRDLSS